MRKLFVCLTAVMLCVALAAGASAAGVTLRTFTPFADMDFSAQAYMDLITSWETETGNVVEDFSGLQDEAYMEQLRTMIDSGEADIVVVPAGLGLSGLVPVDELLAAAPDCGARRFPSISDGTPIRLNWEALYVNKDVLDANGLSVPQTFDELVAVCAALSQKGILPIANALCEWPEIVLDCAALLGAPEDQYGQAASLDGAKTVLTTLTQVGAFGSDPWNMEDLNAEAAFLSGQAAMRFDAYSLAQTIPAERHASTLVIQPAGKDGQPRTAVVGTPSFVLSMTRACFDDPARREAALSLFKTLNAHAADLSTDAAGSLGESIARLSTSASNCTGLLYDMNADGFDSWAEGVVASLMSIQPSAAQ